MQNDTPILVDNFKILFAIFSIVLVLQSNISFSQNTDNTEPIADTLLHNIIDTLSSDIIIISSPSGIDSLITFIADDTTKVNLKAKKV